MDKSFCSSIEVKRYFPQEKPSAKVSPGKFPINLEMPSDVEFESNTDDSSISEEVLIMKNVRFNSCVILPSQKNYCSIDY